MKKCISKSNQPSQWQRSNQPDNSTKIVHFLYAFVGINLGACLVAGLALSMSSTSATTGTASDSKASTARVTVSSACFMTAHVDIAHTATVPGGIWSGGNDYYPDGIGKTTISTFCNDASGYSLYAVGYTGDSTSGNNTVLHSAQLGNIADIATGTAQNGNISNWAMKVTKVTDSSTSYLPNNLTIQNGFDSANYHTVPATYTEVARYSSATDLTLGSKLETTYSAYIAPTQPASEYVGKVKYTLVHPGGTEAPEIDTMQNVAYWGGALTVGEEKTVTDSRDGQTYTVARLCTNYSGDNCTSSQIWMTQNLNLQIGGYYNNQKIVLDSRNTDLNDAFEPDGTTLKKDYSVSGSIITWTPTAANTTNPSLSQANNTLSGAPATISSFAYSSSATSVVTGWSNQNYYGYQAEGTKDGEEVFEYPVGDWNSRDTIIVGLQNCINTGHTAAECKHYQVGNYYNWTAANAMSNSSQYTAQYTVAENSICPKGWRLPKGLTNDNGTIVMSEFNKLLLAQGVASTTDLSGGAWQSYASSGFQRIQTTGIYGDPLYFARSGRVNDTTLYNSSSSGHYWSSTVATPATNGYSLDFGLGGLIPAYQHDRLYGFSVRCLAR